MTVLSLNTNVSSLQTQRRLADSTSALSRTFERLSSGLRVARASDDAAGLAVASGLNVDSRVFTQGLRNLSDGIGVTNIAEGALNELTNIVLRLEELAEQAANGTLGTKQRAALDAEAQALSKEYLRIAKTTEFNGLKLFDGSVQGLSLQAGYGASGALQASLGGKLGTGGFDERADLDSGNGARATSLGDLNGDGLLDMAVLNALDQSVSIFLGNGDGTFKAQACFDAAEGDVIVLGDLNSDSVLDIVCPNTYDGRVVILLGNGDGSFNQKTEIDAGTIQEFALADLNSDGALDLATNNFDEAGTVFLGNGDGTFKPGTPFDHGLTSYGVAAGDLNGDDIADLVTADFGENTASVMLGNGDGTFRARLSLATDVNPFCIALGDVSGDGNADVVVANWGDGTASVVLGKGDGTFGAKAEYTIGRQPDGLNLADLNGDGALDMIVGDRYEETVSVLIGNGNGTFAAKTDFAAGVDPCSTSLGDLNRDGVLDLVTGNDASDSVSVFLGKTREGVSPLLDFSLKIRSDAKWALELMKQKLTQLSQQRGIIGANQSRLTTAVATLQVERENYEAAASQIMDADVASESARLLKTQILQQAAAAVLGQANAAPALALKLLQG